MKTNMFVIAVFLGLSAAPAMAGEAHKGLDIFPSVGEVAATAKAVVLRTSDDVWPADMRAERDGAIAEMAKANHENQINGLTALGNDTALSPLGSACQKVLVSDCLGDVYSLVATVQFELIDTLEADKALKVGLDDMLSLLQAREGQARAQAAIDALDELVRNADTTEGRRVRSMLPGAQTMLDAIGKRLDAAEVRVIGSGPFAAN